MTRDELRQRWIARRDEWARLHAHVDGAAIAEEILQDLDQLERSTAAESLTREEAAAAIGCHVDSITRLIRQGKLRNVGTRGRPKVVRAELEAVRRSGRSPRRGPLATGRGVERSSATCPTNADSLAREAITSRLSP